MSVADTLAGQNLRVLTVGNGGMGIEVFERKRPDLVSTDLRGSGLLAPAQPLFA